MAYFNKPHICSFSLLLLFYLFYFIFSFCCTDFGWSHFSFYQSILESTAVIIQTGLSPGRNRNCDLYWQDRESYQQRRNFDSSREESQFLFLPVEFAFALYPDVYLYRSPHTGLHFHGSVVRERSRLSVKSWGRVSVDRTAEHANHVYACDGKAGSINCKTSKGIKWRYDTVHD